MIKAKNRKTFFLLILLGFALSVFFLYHRIILMAAGDFLSPEGSENAEVVILEGTELMREKSIEIAIDLLSSGETGRLVIVYHNSRNERIFARHSYYDLFLIKALEDLGVKKDKIQVIEVPKDHPITLTEAQIVLSNLSKQQVKSAILLAEGFHTRRSFWSYKQVGLPMGIKIIPHPYFTKYRNDNWWLCIDGIFDFVDEGMKFFYYLISGYIPIKSLVAT